jgi:hypothetical protein
METPGYALDIASSDVHIYEGWKLLIPCVIPRPR